MIDSNGRIISIGDRVKLLWNFDNKHHTGRIVEINKDRITITTSGTRMSTSDPSRITKIQKSLI
ncbi:MAG: hypothetical protein K8R25_06510 [Methanosarcinales archaeon]|nr:hypothetical protein [Methanosarcinales archaeon]